VIESRYSVAREMGGGKEWERQEREVYKSQDEIWMMCSLSLLG
jgi:hypothetical protein